MESVDEFYAKFDIWESGVVWDVGRENGGNMVTDKSISLVLKSLGGQYLPRRSWAE